jgi:DNA polymerase I
MQSQKKKEKLFIAIDGNAIIHRAYHAYPLTLTNAAGTPVNAIYGFTVMMLEVLKRFDPEYIVCAFDTGKPTFRHLKYTDYKVHRKLPEPALLTQFPLVEDLVRAFNIPVIMVDGFEADDVLGTLAQYVKKGKWSGQELKMIIVSGDRDLLQLIDQDVNVCLPQGSFKSLTVFNKDTTKERYGYYPEQVIDYKAIVGDPSDNIPGIKGVGDKSAFELLEKYGSLDEIYKNLSQIKPRQAKLFAEGIEQAEFSRDLATITVDVPFNVMLEDCVMRDFSRQRVVDEFIKYEFKSLIDKIPASSGDGLVNASVLGLQVNNEEFPFTDSKAGESKLSLDKSGSQFNMFGGEVGLDMSLANGDNVGASNGDGVEESNSAEKTQIGLIEIEELSNEVLTLSINDSVVELYFAFIERDRSLSGQDFLLVGVFVDGILNKYSVIHIDISSSVQLKCFTDLVVNSERETIGFDFENMVERFFGVQLQSGLVYDVNRFADKVCDVKLLSHVISSASKGFDLSSLAFEYLKQNLPEKFSENDGGSILKILFNLKKSLFEKANEIEISSFSKINIDRVIQKYENSQAMSWLVASDNKSSKSADEFNVLLDFTTKFEARVATILAEVEQRGLQIDVELLKILKVELEEKIADLEKKVFEYVGHEFNLNSPKQLSNILYNTLHLPKVGTGKKALSTDEDTLTELQAYSEIVAPILDSRRLKKLLGTYVDAFLEIMAKRSKDELPVIHTDYKMTVASSGRLSSQNPNLQNLPVKGDYAERFREVFIAREGYKMVSIDYSQIELRMMAEISQDKDLIEIFKNGADIHRATAAKIFNVAEDLVTKEQRSIAKTVVFGVLYGQTPFGLSKQLSISREDAAKYISEYFNEYQGVAVYIDDATKKAQRIGYVESMFGRRRYISGLNADNRMVRAAAIREAVNMPLQGSAADLMKLSMIVVDDLIKREFLGKAFILLQIHDELVFEVAPEVLDEFEGKVCDAMRTVMDFSVPLEIHFSSGNNLAELK